MSLQERTERHVVIRGLGRRPVRQLRTPFEQLVSRREQLHGARFASRIGQPRERRQGGSQARAEALERLSPQDRAQVSRSARTWATLPSDRQTAMRGAFRDLRGVPPDQRETVLNSNRYRNAFSPEERGVLSDMLRVEPYEPQ